jgi:hypothetical protein
MGGDRALASKPLPRRLPEQPWRSLTINTDMVEPEKLTGEMFFI